MADKLTSIKIKQKNGSYTTQIPVSVSAQNVQWDGSHSLLDILGSVDINVGGKGNVQHQFDDLYQNIDAFTDDINSEMTDFTNSTNQSITDFTNTANQNFTDFTNATNQHLSDVLGNISTETKGTVQAQMDKLQNDMNTFHTQMAAEIGTDVSDWLQQNVTPAGSMTMVDNSLTISDAAADAKAVGDALTSLNGSLENLDNEINPAEREYSYAFNGRYVSYSSGSKRDANAFSITNFIPVSGIKRITYTRIAVAVSTPVHGMAFFSSNATNTYISGIASLSNASEAGSELYTADVPEGANYAQFTWWSEDLRETRGEFALYDADQYDDSLNTKVSKIKKTLEKMIENGIGEIALVADVPQNEGVQNAILTAHQFTDIIWTPVADMPGIYRDPETQEIRYKTHKKGCRQSGIPYGSGNLYEQRVNDSISFDTFATAVKNENSVLYTNNEYAEGRKKAAYYGVACSKLVQACWGAPEFVDSQQIYKLPGIVKIADPGEFTVDDLQLGDGILNPQVHCTIVTGIFRNTKGQVVSVEISEAVMPTCRRLTWTKSEFYEHFATYGLYRYPQIVNATYRKARYIDLDDGVTAPEDIPIAIKRGSYINMSTSVSREAVVNNTRWTTLHDVVNGEDVTGEISSSEITLPKNRIGYHEIYPTDANGNRGNSSFYFVYENTVSASVSEGYVTVTYTSNAPAVLIFFNSTNYEYIENDTGIVTAEIPTGATSCKILFRSEYGTFFSAPMSLTT